MAAIAFELPDTVEQVRDRIRAYSVQVGLRAVDQAMQAHGAMGLTNEVGLAEAWQYLRIINIADGSNEILNKTIARRLLKGDVDL